MLTSTQPGTAKYWVAWGLEICAYTSVDIFGLLSGYLGYGKKRFNSYRCFELLSTTILYSILATILFGAYMPQVLDSQKNLIKSLFPCLAGRYWYITCYIPVAILAPLMNKFLFALTAKQHKLMCKILIILFSVVPSIVPVDFFRFKDGYSFAWLEILYLIGGYLRRNNCKLNHKEYISFFLGAVGMIFAIKMGAFYFIEKETTYMISYVSILILIMSISCLRTFAALDTKKISAVKKKFLTQLSEVAFDVYIIHSHILVYDYLIYDNFKWISNYNVVLMSMLIILSCGGMYIIAGIMGSVRIKIYKCANMKKCWNQVTKDYFSYQIK